MTEIFNLNRFYNSFLRLISEKGIKMMGSIVLMILFFFLLFNVETDPRLFVELQDAFLVLGLSFGPILYMSVVSNEMSTTSKGTAYLLLPNSIFEKWFLNSVVALIMYFIIFCSLYYCVDFLMVKIVTAQTGLPEGTLTPVEFFSDKTYIGFMVGAAMAQGVILGSLFFKKNNLVYSLLFMFGVLIFIVVVNYFSANFFFDVPIYFGNQVPYALVYIDNDLSLSGGYLIENPMTMIQLSSLIFVPFIIAFSGIYFMRLKEKEL